MIRLDPKSYIFTFKKKTWKIFVSRIRDFEKNHKIFFCKCFFKSRVQSIGNCLICLDPKSCIFIFCFEKTLEIFLSCVRDLANYEIFFLRMVSKSGVQSIGNCFICLDPKSYIFFLYFCVARQGHRENHKIFL